MSECVYTCVDQEHNTWSSSCGFLSSFEADGPRENGWNVCPACGREIFQEDAG